MGTLEWHCVYRSHPTSVPTSWWGWVHASLHLFMSTWPPISPQTPMHIYMDTWLLLYRTVFVCQSTHLCSHTLFRMWECISPCTYVHPTLHVYSNLLWIVTWKCGCPICHCVCVSQSHCLWSHTLVRMYTCITTWFYVELTTHVCSTPYAKLYGNVGDTVW